MPDNRMSNLGKDLTKARQQAMLIEVLQNDLESWADQSTDVFRTVCDASAAVFDAGVKAGKTNVLAVGEEEGNGPSSIFGILLGSLDNEFDDLHKRQILAKLAGFGLSQAFGSVVGDAVGDNLHVGAEKMIDYLAEWRGSTSDYLSSFYGAGVELLADGSSDILGAIGEAGSELVTGQFSSDNNIYLSRPAHRRLRELAPRLSKEATSHETLQLALEMLLATAQGAPKVIVVNDPLRLDDASLALLAMLVSLEKDLRQVNQTEKPGLGKAQTAGISVVLTFTGPQPHDTVENKDIVEKQRAISRLRMMASRYSLLERLDSDIPAPAVRASTFVGRNAELQSLWQDWNTLCDQTATSAKQSWCLIKGEPGTGKTALANYFIQQVRSDIDNPTSLSIPTLRMLNQTGHNAQATGLASLKNSVVDELRRLSLIHEESVGWFARFGQQVTEDVQRWTKDFRSVDPEAKKRTRGRVSKVISRLLGVDAAVEVVRSAKAWSEQDNMHSMREQEFGQSSQADHKEEQYELLREALREISKLARVCMPGCENQTDSAFPLLFLIDDLQWMDDFTAEFLLNEWPKDMPVYIIATARGSDSFTMSGDTRARQAENRHRNRLFSELGLVDANLIGVERESSEEKEQKYKKEGQYKWNISLASRLELRGMDQPMLASLIKLTFVGISQDQAEQFAAGVIKNLSGADDGADAVTLFTIETLNVLSDPQFYLRNPELCRLIEPLPGMDRYRFQEPENSGLSEALDNIFKNLTTTYQASYQGQNIEGSGEGRFNLASYAVLEERLHLIEQYFGEYGGTARYSLLFSALLGSPFQSGLVRHVIGDLKQLLPEQHPDLAPFLEALQKDVSGSLGPTHYEVLERAYEIIRRLDGKAGRYVHQHNLLQQFLLGQLTQLVGQAWPELGVLEKGIARLVGRVELSVSDWFAGSTRDNIQGLSDDDVLKIERGRCLTALTGYWHDLMKSRCNELGAWAWAYADALKNLARIHSQLGHPQLAQPLLLEAVSIQRIGYEVEPNCWIEAYLFSLDHLARTHDQLGYPEDAYPLIEEARSIWCMGFESESDRWAKGYAAILNNLAGFQYKSGSPEVAAELLEEALSIRRELYESSTESCGAAYATSLNNLAHIYNRLGHPEEALPLVEESVAIRRDGYYLAPECWAETYSSSLSNLAQTLSLLGRSAEALTVHNEALSIRRKGYELVPDRWAQAYVTSLNHLGMAHGQLGRLAQACSILEESVSVCRKGYESIPERWAWIYSSSLCNLAKIYGHRSRSKEALSLYGEALSIQRKGYESAPRRWAEAYVVSLNSRASVYNRIGLPEDALPLHKQAVSIGQIGYESAPDRWAEAYTASLNNLANTQSKLGRHEEALPHQEDALSIRREGYAKAPDQWARAYMTSLSNLGDILKNLGRFEGALLLEQEALLICRKGYESTPEHWSDLYASILGRLAATYDRLGHCPEEALSLHEEALFLRRKGYELKPERWVETYVVSLNNLANSHCQLGFVEEALPLYEEALSILRKRMDADRHRWADTFLVNLKNLANAYTRLGRSEDALALLVEASSLRAGGERH